MREFAVVILSNEPEKLTACLDALKRCEPSLPADRIIVVGGEAVWKDVIGFQHRCRLIVQSGERFNFSREVNRGLAAAGPTVDVFLLGDDARLTMSGTIGRLSSLADARGGMCILSPAVVGRAALCDGDEAWSDQFRPDGRCPERLLQVVPFFAVYLPSEVRRMVGELDERFTDYGSDDDDYCYRARLAGVPIILLPRISFHHQKESRKSHAARWGADRFGPGGGINRRHLIEKHGSYPLPTVPYYVQPKTPSPPLGKQYQRRAYEVFTVSGNSANYRRLLASIRQFQPDLLGNGRLHCYAGWKAEEVDGAGSEFLIVPQVPGPFSVTRENNRALMDIWGRGRDAILVEDDVELTSPGTFDHMAIFAEAYQGRCLVQPAIDGYRYDNVVTIPSPNYKVRIEPRHYPIICVYFPIEVELIVGYYDENFSTYGGDDNDYSLRCQQAGILQLALPRLVVRHQYQRSVYALNRTRDRNASVNYFTRKWGHSP